MVTVVVLELLVVVAVDEDDEDDDNIGWLSFSVTQQNICEAELNNTLRADLANGSLHDNDQTE